MTLNLRGILRATFGVGTVVGMFMLIVPLVDLIYDDTISFSFLFSGLVLIVIGYLLSRMKTQSLTSFEAAVVAVISWIMMSVISAIDMCIETKYAFIDTLFESVSGFTGTGFSVFVLKNMKYSIILWRSLMQWIGELGFTVFAILILPYFYYVAREVYGVERPVKIEITFYKTAIRLLIIYGSLTFIGAVAYIITGMSGFEAINHIMTTIATGGMSIYDQGYQLIFLRAPFTYIPMVIFMILGGMNFQDLNNLVTGKFKELLKSEEFMFYLIMLMILSSLVYLSYLFVDNIKTDNVIPFALFNTISGYTTTGFNLGLISKLRDTTKILLVISMFIGGMSFSTAGGIKTFRLLLFLKKIKHYAQSIVLPSSVIKPVKFDEKTVSEAEFSQVLFIIIMHALMIIIGALIVSAYGNNFTDSLFEATSAASNVGLSSGIVSMTDPFTVKITLIILMILGRLEYLPLFLALSLMFREKIIKRK
ncbi:MAG: TrkH family potassium uptake protein [Thermoprotei archaeon]